MKKQNILLTTLIFITFFSCRHHNGGNVSINYSESRRYYTMNARFDEDRTRAVEAYMDEQLGSASNTSFVNTRIDGRIALDDHTVFYIRIFPGQLKIELDKYKNSADSYYKVKSMCEGLKDMIAGK